MPAPIDPNKRAAIAAAIRAGHGTRSRNDIAREYGVAAATVGNIAIEHDIADAFDRTLTSRASSSKRADNQARRVAEAVALLDELLDARTRLRERSDQLLPSGQVVTLERPPARDLRDIAMAYQALAKTHMDLDRHDASTDGVLEGRSLIREFMAAVVDSVDPTVSVRG